MQHRQMKKHAITPKTGIGVVDEILSLAGKKHRARFRPEFKTLKLAEQSKRIRALGQEYGKLVLDAAEFKKEVHKTLEAIQLAKSGAKLQDAKARLFGILSGKMHSLEERLSKARTVSGNIFAEFHPGTTTRRLTPFEAHALKCERILHQTREEYSRARAMISLGAKQRG